MERALFRERGERGSSFSPYSDDDDDGSDDYDEEEVSDDYVEIEFVRENELYVVVDGSAKGTGNVCSMLKLRFVEIVLTYADKRGEGGQNLKILLT